MGYVVWEIPKNIKEGISGGVVGYLRKTQKSTATKNDKGEIESVAFYEQDENSNIRYTIKQSTNEILIIDFFLECDKKKE